MNDIQAKLDLLNGCRVKNPDQMSEDERKQYLDALRSVVGMAGRVVSADGELSEDEGSIIQIRGKFPLGMTPLTVMPLKNELQKAFDSLGRKSFLYGVKIDVVSVFSERNFNHIQQRFVNTNSLFEEDELFVKMGSPEQASCILGSVDNVYISVSSRPCIVRFSAPSYGARLRNTYRDIGKLMKRLHYIDNELRSIGAVSGLGGIPVLPEKFVHMDEFDATVQTFKEKSSKDDLHMYLVAKIRVDKRRMETAFELLVNERVGILLKLCNYDQFETPFSFTRAFV